MTVPFVCVFIAFLMIYLAKIPVGIAMNRLPGGYDNHLPRDQQAQLTGWGKRAMGVHQNSFEAFAPFAAAVLVAHVGGANPRTSAYLAVGFILARLVYAALYLADLASLRSSVWFVGIICTGALFVLPCFKS